MKGWVVMREKEMPFTWHIKKVTHVEDISIIPSSRHVSQIRDEFLFKALFWQKL